MAASNVDAGGGRTRTPRTCSDLTACAAREEDQALAGQARAGSPLRPSLPTATLHGVSAQAQAPRPAPGLQ